MNRDHSLADKEEIYLEDLIPYTLLFPRGNAITKKNVLKNAKEKARIELRLEEIPYSLILHTVYTKDFVGVTPASVFRCVDFPELICKPIKHNGEIFYMLEIYLVTMKQENYKVETEKYIAYEKRLHKDRYI